MLSAIYAPAAATLRDFSPKAVVTRILAAIAAADAAIAPRRDHGRSSIHGGIVRSGGRSPAHGRSRTAGPRLG